METSNKNWYTDFESMKKFADSMLGCMFRTEMCHISEDVKSTIKAESKYGFLKEYTAWNQEQDLYTIELINKAEVQKLLYKSSDILGGEEKRR